MAKIYFPSDTNQVLFLDELDSLRLDDVVTDSYDGVEIPDNHITDEVREAAYLFSGQIIDQYDDGWGYSATSD